MAAPRIEQRDNLARNRIDTCQVRTLAEVAAVTRTVQIAMRIVPVMLARHNVLDVVRKGRTVLRKEAIFAAVAGSGSDESPRRRLHLYGFGKLPAGL